MNRNGEARAQPVMDDVEDVFTGSSAETIEIPGQEDTDIA